ncbi:MAG: DUF2088 domain-containing protein [Akkermansiaceae bacterium]|nr:DUF2088 domain-containing protein [Akkermansiaceae bacterium]NNM30292.1 DUF2088 domain-containing protein [Akkermansiaceae bacterium]
MVYLATGSPDAEFTDAGLREALTGALEQIGPRRKVLAVPPDNTRFYSKAGLLTCIAHDHYGPALTDVMPALGTHFPMTAEQLDRMFPGLPHDLIREHRWRDDVVTVGEVPADYVRDVTGGIYDKPWPAQMNKLVREGGHDLVLSIGQVVPHEVIGMANGNKNIFVGTGGQDGINESHFIGAAYGMERMMGRTDTPLRRILNYAEREFCRDLPLLYVLTVVGPDHVVRGLFIGDDPECFEAAADLAKEVNFTQLDQPLEKVVVYLDPDEFHSTWLGNKAIYRTRMAIADQGELLVLAPGVKSFGEDPEIDLLIRKYGYRTTPEVMDFVRANEDLRNNLSAAAHLIHGSSEDRFAITYAPGHLTRHEIESVGYQYHDLDHALKRYNPAELKNGWNGIPGIDGEEELFYYISNPALGLWAEKSRLAD